MKKLLAAIGVAVVAFGAFLTNVQSVSADVIAPPKQQKQKPAPKPIKKKQTTSGDYAILTYDIDITGRNGANANQTNGGQDNNGKVDNNQGGAVLKPEVFLNHDEGVYYEGDKLTLSVESPVDGYLYVLHYNAEGKRTLIVPNKFMTDNKIRAGETVEYPSESMDFDFNVTGPTFGLETISVLVTSRPISPNSGKSYTKDAFTSLEDALWTEFVSAAKAIEGNKDLQVARRSDVNVPIGNVKPKPDPKPQPKPDPKPDPKPQPKPEPKPEPKPGSKPQSKYQSILANVSYTTYPKGGNVDANQEDDSQNKVDANQNVDANQDAGKASRYAICIGVNKYKDVRIGKLLACANDAALFSQLCANEFGVYPDNIYLVTDEYVAKSDVLELLDRASANFPNGSEVFIFWSGHGYKTSSTSQKKQAYLVPYDGKISDAQNTMISADELADAIAKFAGKKVLLFVDACYSGGLGDGMKSTSASSVEDFTLVDDLFAQLEAKTSSTKGINSNDVYVIASSNDSQPSFESLESRREKSVFTKTLAQKIADAASPLTHKDLKAKVKSAVEEEVRRTFPGAHQTVVEQDKIAKPVVLK